MRAEAEPADPPRFSGWPEEGLDEGLDESHIVVTWNGRVSRSSAVTPGGIQHTVPPGTASACWLREGLAHPYPENTK